MKIRELYIDGFGHFHDRRMGPFTSPVVVLHGPNEAGKTTLLEFIRTILFGFPARHRGQHYPPLAGGRHGGRLSVIDDAGHEYVIERFAGPHGGPVRIRDGSGAQQDEAVLANLLGHASQDMFTNVFAFSLEELQTGNLLKDTHVNGQIYSAGLGAAKLPAVLKTLQARRDKIFLSGGRKHLISGLLMELQDVDNKLDEVSGHAAQYSRLVARREDIDDTLARLRAEHSQLQARHGEMSKLEEAWEDWIDLMDAEARLKGIPHFDGFPADPLVRLDNLEQRLRAARAEVQEAQEQLGRAETAATMCLPDEAMLADRDAIIRINRGRNAFDGSLRDLPERQAELRHLEESLARRLRNLGTDWDAKRLEGFDLSIAFRDQIAHWHKRLSQSQEQVRAARSDQVQAEQHLSEQHKLEVEARQILAAAQPPPLTPSQLEERRAALRMSRTRRGEYERLHQRHADLRYQLESVSHETTVLQSPLNQTTPDCSPPAAFVLPPREATRSTHANFTKSGLEPLGRLPQVLLALSGAALLGLGALLGTQALILGAIAAAGAFGMVLYLWLRGRKAPSAAPSAQTSALQRLVQNASDAEAEARQRFQDAARSLALDLPDAAALDQVEAEIEAQERLRRHWDALHERVAEATRHVRWHAQRLEEARQRLHQVEGVDQHLQETWKHWLSAHALPPLLMPATMDEFIGHVEAARVELDRVKGTQHRVAAIEVDIQEYQDLVLPLADKYAISVTPDGVSQVAMLADLLIERFETARDQIMQRHTAQEEAAQARRRYARRQTQLREAEEALHSLLRAAGAESPEVFRLKAAQYAERLEIKTHKHACQMRLQRLSGPGEALGRLQTRLAQTNKPAITDTLHQLCEQSRTLEHQRHALLEERGSVETLIKQLSEEHEAAILRMQRNLLREQLREAAREWSKLRLAEELLRRARWQFEQERQPGVIQQAQQCFTTVTNQRYARLFAPIGEQTITVIDQTGGEKSPADLSRGTREQLYLALRFGLIREFCTRAESLPVVVDEILVNFDPDRAQRAAQAFADLAQTNQVLVFTCHPAMLATFTAACARAQVIHIRR
jgi:uncharacterized protein YhaN